MRYLVKNILICEFSQVNYEVSMIKNLIFDYIPIGGNTAKGVSGALNTRERVQVFFVVILLFNSKPM